MKESGFTIVFFYIACPVNPFIFFDEWVLQDG
jgi:hypothetical protein